MDNLENAIGLYNLSGKQLKYKALFANPSRSIVSADANKVKFYMSAALV